MNNLLISSGVQNALFDLLRSDKLLAPLFSKVTGPRAALPRLEFDYLQTHAEDADDLFRHQFQFSVWSDLHNFTQGDHIANRVHKLFHLAQPTLENATMLLMQFEMLMMRKDTPTRLNQHQLKFNALTQNA